MIGGAVQDTYTVWFIPCILDLRLYVLSHCHFAKKHVILIQASKNEIGTVFGLRFMDLTAPTVGAGIWVELREEMRMSIK